MTPDPDHAIPGPGQLRAALTDEIRAHGVIRAPRVEAAFRAVPRHLFLPGTDLRAAYAAQVVVTRRAPDGTALSSASHPAIVAAMLEQLDVRPGQRILEVGAGTGINAALLQELTGPAGQVTTIDIDPAITAEAARGLAAAGYDRVQVACGDGADGHAPAAPFDRIIITAGAWDLAPAWWQQLAPGGRLVVPLVLHPSGLTRSIAFDYQPGQMISRSAQVCGFVAMRGATAPAEHAVRLADDITLHFDAGGLASDAALSRALACPRYEQWTSIVISDSQPAEHLDLWLATTTGGRFGRLWAGRQARDSGQAAPALRWGGAAVHDDDSLAYLALRPRSPGIAELGVIAHGPASRRLAAQTAEHLRSWSRDRPDQPFITAWPAGTPSGQLPSGHRIDKPGSCLTVSW